MNIKRQEETLMGWSIMWWLFKLFGLPITIPWLIYHFLDIMQQKRKRAALSSKVIYILLYIFFHFFLKRIKNRIL